MALRDVVTNARLLGEEEYVVRGSASVYHALLHLMPSSVCSWFTELRDRQLIASVESYTSKRETPALIDLEMRSVTSRGELEVTALQKKNEVVTRYRKDDSTLELVIKLPASFPLRPVEVEYVQKFGFGEAVLRKWLLSMRAFLRNQDGTIDDALYFWYQNVEKQFDGVEECPICYSIIQTTDHTLPRLKCRTCGKKFHSACMFKWFNTNHKSTCPMCRTLW
uniref:E3 ubiquitin-protein ligase listerin n=1 Tax=Phaeocystis cordata TaxID=118079 RepID=A0A7S1HRD2_9EUKA